MRACSRRPRRVVGTSGGDGSTFQSHASHHVTYPPPGGIAAPQWGQVMPGAALVEPVVTTRSLARSSKVDHGGDVRSS